MSLSVRLKAAEWYEREWVPAMLQDWAEHTTDAARVEAGHRVLDVGCGTGVVARECARRVGDPRNVTGLDLSEEMLTVARRLAPEIEWRHGEAGSLPFADESFDRVVSQFALMFFPDRVAAVGEMWRVLTPGGRMAVTVAGPIDDSPAYVVLAELIRRHGGGADIEERFVLGDSVEVAGIFESAGVTDFALGTYSKPERFASPAAFAEAEVQSSAELVGLFDEESWNALLEDAEQELASFVTDDGRLEFQSSGITVTAAKA